MPTLDPATGRHHARALALVRLHTRPLGMVELAMGGEGLDAAAFAERIWATLGSEIAGHLSEDGLAVPSALPTGGLADDAPCLHARELLLADAPSVSVVIPTRDRPELLKRCLDALLTMDYPQARFEILVADNAPQNSDTHELVTLAYGDEPAVRYVREDRQGISAARNRALQLAEGDIVAFTDDDAVVDRHWLSELVHAFDAAPAVACVTGLILPLELEAPAQQLFEEYGGFSKGFRRRVFQTPERRAASPLFPYAAGVFGSGNNMAFRRSVLAQLGGFDPALGAGTPTGGGEDLDAFFRTVVNGHALVYEPAAIVHHLHGVDYEALRRKVYGYGAGLTAYLAHSLSADRQTWMSFAVKVPRSLPFVVRRQVSKARDMGDHPYELRTLELRGWVYGPIGYARSRLGARGRHA